MRIAKSELRATPTPLLLRPLTPADLPAARALLEAERARHPYAERPLEQLESIASGGPDGEYRALVAADESGIAGVLLYGLVAGSVGAGMLFGAVVAPESRGRGIGRALADAGVAALVSSGARAVFAELPDDPALGDVRSLLARAGFSEEGRVSDLLRDGVALTIWRRAAEPER